ncbi:unnamed protein product [Litomosoides sigmodontis]|uniref:RRM domain-containing protein n=1 Tax=Litomosoides sigmodontis TaxID=42156 RepID=A0A3P6SQP3_LITSI|nr:unnamed protein product [Litomosoides sigmodontis]
MWALCFRPAFSAAPTQLRVSDMSGRRSSYRDNEIPTLYVRQVHYSARPDDLRALFERIGPVRDVYIPLDYYTRESRGFAYVKFEFTRDAEDALKELNGASIFGRRIEVEWAEGQRKTKTEMRSRDSYSSYRVRNRYRSRSPYKSERERSLRYRSRSKRRSHSRSTRRLHNSRRRSSKSKHYSSARSRNSRSTSSSSSSIQKERDRNLKIHRSESPQRVCGSLLHSLDEIKDPTDGNQDIVGNEYNISNRRIADEINEPSDELEIRSEARISDVEIDEKQVQETVLANGSTEYIEDHLGVEVDGNASAAEAAENHKMDTDIEVIDEVVEQNGVFFSDTVIGGNCVNNNINIQELPMTDTTC